MFLQRPSARLPCRTDSQVQQNESAAHLIVHNQSVASHSFVERNVRPEKYQSRSLPADMDNQNATRHLFHSTVK